MRKRLLSTRQLAEIKRAILQERKANIPFMRFICKQGNVFSVQEMYTNVSGVFTHKKTYQTDKKPESAAETIVIVEDI